MAPWQEAQWLEKRLRRVLMVDKNGTWWLSSVIVLPCRRSWLRAGFTVPVGHCATSFIWVYCGPSENNWLAAQPRKVYIINVLPSWGAEKGGCSETRVAFSQASNDACFRQPS